MIYDDQKLLSAPGMPVRIGISAFASASPVQHEKVNYQLEAIKLYYYNCILYHQFDKLLEERSALLQKLQKYKEKYPDSQNSNQLIGYEKKKKYRRCAQEIERQFSCPFPGCKKSYGTEGSMSQHLRLKHEEFVKQYQTQKAKKTENAINQMMQQQSQPSIEEIQKQIQAQLQQQKSSASSQQ